MNRLLLVTLALLPLAAFAAADYTEKKSTEWTPEEAKQVLEKSPWVVESQVFPAALRAPDEAQSKPTTSMMRVPVTIAWYSAGIYRTALASLFKDLTPEQLDEMTRPNDRFYIIEVTAPETLGVFDSVTDEELTKATSLEVDGQKFPLLFLIQPKDLKAPKARFIFDRGAGIPAKAKTAVFHTAARDVSLDAKFKLEKMTWLGKRDIDGDLGEISPGEKRRREVQTAVLGTETPEFHRAIVDVRLEKLKDKDRPWAAYVFYEPSREGKDVDVAARKLGIVQRVGTWSAANDTAIQAIVFLNPKNNKAQDYVLGPDAEKIAKMAPEGAAAAFKDKLTPADKKPEAPKPAATDKPKKSK
jgi:hypothetical protein